jgi:hypothetical protein
VAYVCHGVYRPHRVSVGTWEWESPVARYPIACQGGEHMEQPCVAGLTACMEKMVAVVAAMAKEDDCNGTGVTAWSACFTVMLSPTTVKNVVSRMDSFDDAA